MICPDTLKTVAGQWRINLKLVRSDISLQGSPERSLFRTAVEDETGAVFILEEIDPNQCRQRHFIGQFLDHLYASGLRQLSPYLKTPAGEYLSFCDDRWWQASSYIEGTLLDRPGYIQDAQKGKALARFLCDFARHARRLPHTQDMPSFSLKHYVLKLEKEMKQHDPEVATRFVLIFDFLRSSFMEAHDTLPITFCHGDYHPLNVIWREHAIEAVIDWEFCGPKPDIYDTANLLGCIGMENPSGLVDGLAMTFMRIMRQTPTVSTQSWQLLVEFMIALRFAWLAEWLRKKDQKMIELEEVYMKLLLDNMGFLKEAWGLSRF